MTEFSEAQTRPSGEFLDATTRRAGEFPESIKKGPKPQKRTHGRDGKKSAADGVPSRLLEQAKTGLNRAAEALPEGAPHPTRRPIAPPSCPDRSPSVPASSGDAAEGAVGSDRSEVTGAVTGLHAREARILAVDIGAHGAAALLDDPLRSLLAYAEREVARRAKGVHPGMVRLQDDELAALLDVLRPKVGTVAAQEARGR